MSGHIQLRGVRVHNLKGVDLDIPLRKLTVLTGVSGAGKSSLAFDTLYAESQRRYVQGFSAYSRQFLEQFEPPAADHIGFLPPAMAVRRLTPSWRTTVGTITETAQDLQLLFSRLGVVVCPDCQRTVAPATPQSVAHSLLALVPGTRVQLAFEWPVSVSAEQTRELLRHAGFSRAIAGGVTLDLTGDQETGLGDPGESITVIVDRITSGRTDAARVHESLETAFAHGGGDAFALVSGAEPGASARLIDGQPWEVRRYSVDFRCPGCQRRFPTPEPALFQHQSALGACPRCRGAGVTGTRVRETCSACQGARLNPEALAVRLDNRNFAEWTALAATDTLSRWMTFWGTLAPEAQAGGRVASERLRDRLQLLADIGLGHLALDRAAATLSPGEGRRVQLVAALGTRLVNMLCILDEPTAGLHRADTDRILRLLKSLRDAGNTLVVVEHNPDVIAAADLIVELGPGAGPDGGTIVDRRAGGMIRPLREASETPLVSSEEQADAPRSPLGWLTLSHIRCRNLRDLTVSFPLGVLCVVTGVSGSGKSTLVSQALFRAVTFPRAPDDGFGELAVDAGSSTWRPGDPVVLIDARPLPGSIRSTPGTVLGVTAPIRKLFAQTPDSQARNYGALHFSFNARSEGRCPTCEGLGERLVDLQFLPDLRTVCPDCHGTRFRRETLDVRYRGLSIAEVLAMTARDAFPFFRGQPQLQKRLKTLKDVGLDYLPLGRSCATLSNGEMQRLKLAAALRRGTRTRTLFLMDEPSTGLHSRDVGRLLEVFDLLVTAGHSLIVIDHHPRVMGAAAHIIDLGPGAGAEGGRIVVAGTVDDVRRTPESRTGEILRRSETPRV